MDDLVVALAPRPLDPLCCSLLIAYFMPSVRRACPHHARWAVSSGDRSAAGRAVRVWAAGSRWVCRSVPAGSVILPTFAPTTDKGADGSAQVPGLRLAEGRFIVTSPVDGV